MKTEHFRSRYAEVFAGPSQWRALSVPQGATFAWDDASTYIRKPSFFDDMTLDLPAPMGDVSGARVLALLGDSITTDHISPAGNIAKDSAAAKYLTDHGVAPRDFNQYGARRGNHEVMLRGTFANIRLRNEIVGREGGYTKHFAAGATDGTETHHLRRGHAVPRAQACRSSSSPARSTARAPHATGPPRARSLLGVQAVIAESYERIHRSNLVGMGVLPLEFLPGESRTTLGLTGAEVIAIEGIAGGFKPGAMLTVKADAQDLPREGARRHPAGDRIPAPRRHPAVRTPLARRGLIPLQIKRARRLPGQRARLVFRGVARASEEARQVLDAGCRRTFSARPTIKRTASSSSEAPLSPSPTSATVLLVGCAPGWLARVMA